MDKAIGEKYLNEAYEVIGQDIKSALGGVRFKIENKAGNNVATNKEWHQISIFFNHINGCAILNSKMKLIKENFETILNNSRIILFNKTDCTYYKNVLRTLSLMAIGKHSTGTKITVLGKDNEDVTNKYLEELSTVKKKIEKIIDESDLDFLYNGVLQHSDTGFTDRYLEVIRDKELEYIEFKNTVLVTYILGLLKNYTYPLRLFFMSN